MKAEPIISLRGVTVGHGRQPVLENLTLSVPRGAFVGLLGANGSGKTTLLKTISGILPPLSGGIEFTPRESITGYVPQRESLDSPFLLSSIEIVQMGLCGRISPGKFYGKKDRELAHESLREAGADDLAKRPFAQLSGGQKQKVLIARALASAPDVLLLDEPTAGIDAASTEAIAALLQELNRSGKTVIMVNHDLPVVARVADAIWRVREGKVDCGPVKEMLQ